MSAIKVFHVCLDRMARCTTPELQFDFHIGPEHDETSGTLNLTVVFGPPLGRNGVYLNCFLNYIISQNRGSNRCTRKRLEICHTMYQQVQSKRRSNTCYRHDRHRKVFVFFRPEVILLIFIIGIVACRRDGEKRKKPKFWLEPQKYCQRTVEELTTVDDLIMMVVFYGRQ